MKQTTKYFKYKIISQHILMSDNSEFLNLVNLVCEIVSQIPKKVS